MSNYSLKTIKINFIKNLLVLQNIYINVFFSEYNLSLCEEQSDEVGLYQHVYKSKLLLKIAP